VGRFVGEIEKGDEREVERNESESEGERRKKMRETERITPDIRGHDRMEFQVIQDGFYTV
jgi:hypothetical protein